MEKCRICGRHPAKNVSFQAHQGFVFFRRVANISGVFCRDHALEAYFAARGATLKGMWFNPGSMVFGTLRSIYDSAKLLDLPGEVKDEPFMLHFVACPSCRQKNVAMAGPTECEACGHFFVVVSCASCCTVHVDDKAKSLGDIAFNCLTCGRPTAGVQAARNWGFLVLACVMAEASAIVAATNKDTGAAERETFLSAVCVVLKLDEATAAYLGGYFDKCIAGKAEGFLQTFQRVCTAEYKKLMLKIALSVAQADGFIDEDEMRILHELAEILGFDPCEVYDEIDSGTTGNGISDPWWVVLSVSSNCSMDEVTSAYRRLAMQFHPDTLSNASKDEKLTAELQMKRINAAFDRAQRDIAARSKKEREKASAEKENVSNRADEGALEKEDKSRDISTRDSSVAIVTQRNESKARDSSPEKCPEPFSDSDSPAVTPRFAVALAACGILIPVVVAIVFSARREASIARNERPKETGVRHPMLVENAPENEPVRVPEEDSVGASKQVEIPSSLNRDPKPTRELNQRKMPKVDQREEPAGTKYRPRADIEDVPSRTARRAKKRRAILSDDYDKITKAISHRYRVKAPTPDQPPLTTSTEYLERGIDLSQKGFLDEALRDYDEAMKLDPKNARVYHNRGSVRILKGQYRLAVSDFTNAIKLRPLCGAAFAHRGLAYEMLGSANQASKDYKAAGKLGVKINFR